MAEVRESNREVEGKVQSTTRRTVPYATPTCIQRRSRGELADSNTHPTPVLLIRNAVICSLVVLERFDLSAVAGRHGAEDAGPENEGKDGVGRS